MLKHEYFECSCDSNEHSLRFTHDPEDDEVYITTFLSQYRSFFKRVGVAVKYVLGYKCKYGHWDCTMLSKDEALRLKDWIDSKYKK